MSSLLNFNIKVTSKIYLQHGENPAEVMQHLYTALASSGKPFTLKLVSHPLSIIVEEYKNSNFIWLEEKSLSMN